MVAAQNTLAIAQVVAQGTHAHALRMDLLARRMDPYWVRMGPYLALRTSSALFVPALL